MTTNNSKKSGDIGIAVNKIQGYLNIFQNKGLIQHRILQDGVFGSDTKMSVQQFQRYVKIPVDGMVSEKTWDKMMEQLHILNVVPIIPLVSSSYRLKEGMKGIDVYKMQEYLNLYFSILALDEIMVDGVYEEETKKRVRMYQELHLLKEDGIIGVKTWDYLVKEKVKNSI